MTAPNHGLPERVLAGDFENLAGAVGDIADVSELADALCSVEGRDEYLGVDLPLLRLLEDVLGRLAPTDVVRHARLSARLALELRGDPLSSPRRRKLLESALGKADRSGDAAAVVEVLLAGVHALWEPAPARLSAVDRAVALSREAGLGRHELDARLTRVDVLVGLGRITEAEVELRTVARLDRTSDPGRLAATFARRGTLALIRGRFDEAGHEIDRAEQHARQARRPDRDQLIQTLRACLARERGDPQWAAVTVEVLPPYLARLPGHHFEATLARALFELGREDAARVELARALTSLRARTGPLWLVSVYDAAVVAAALGTEEDREWLQSQLIASGAEVATITVWFAGSTYAMAGVLASARGRHAEALSYLDRAVADLDSMSAVPWSARARRARAKALRALGEPARAEADDVRADAIYRALGLADLPAAPRGVSWALRREAGGWLLDTGAERAHLSASRGLEHLHLLVANPSRDIEAMTLESGGEISAGAVGLEVLDAPALASYRSAVAELDARLAAADRRGDSAAAESLASERAAILAELRRATGLGGRARRTSDADERARINVTRNVRRAIEHISQVAPLAGAHLAGSVRTGAVCRYDPAAGGPQRWVTD